MRKYRSQILVVYPHHIIDGLPADGHRFSQKLKTFAYLPDDRNFRNHLCGHQLTGLIIEEGAVVSHDNFSYLLSRLFGDLDILLMSNENRETLLDVFDYIYDQADDKVWVRKMMDKVMGRVVIR